jgi:hypothetical protein
MGLYGLIDKNMMVFQDFGDMNPTTHDDYQVMNIKAEEVSDAEEEEEEEEEEEDVDPIPITFPKIKAEPEVSCMSLYAHCEAVITDLQKCQLSFCSSVCL